jgi:16S rRNA (uracil1498-N3)-methyltransferase
MNSGLRQRADAAAQVEVLDLQHPELSEEDHHHLAKVLRLRPDEKVALVDGRGSWRIARWRLSPGAAFEFVDGESDVQFESRATPRITVGFALTKATKPEWVVQKLTEVGVDSIVPIVSERTVVKWHQDKAANNVERLRKVADEAAMQSRRVWRPAVTSLTPFGQLPSKQRVLAEPGSTRPLSMAAFDSALDSVAIYVGPEGGWSAHELATATVLVDLGPTILRAETAAIATAIILANERMHQS